MVYITRGLHPRGLYHTWSVLENMIPYLKAPPPPPPPPPPPVSKVALSDATGKGRLEIAGRARTIRVGKIRWPPKPDEPENGETFEPPKKTTNLSQLSVPDHRRPISPPPPSTGHKYLVPLKDPDQLQRSTTPNRLIMDAGVKNRLEHALGGGQISQKPKLVEKRSFPLPVAPSLLENRQFPKPVLDANGIPKAPPPPPGTIVAANNWSNPPLPTRNQAPVNRLPVEIHAAPKFLSSSPSKSDAPTKASMEIPTGNSHYSYNRTHWSMTLRKEVRRDACTVRSGMLNLRSLTNQSSNQPWCIVL